MDDSMYAAECALKTEMVSLRERLTMLENALDLRTNTSDLATLPLETLMVRLSVRTKNCVANAMRQHYSRCTIGDLCSKTRAEILHLPNLGVKGVEELEKELFSITGGKLWWSTDAK